MGRKFTKEEIVKALDQYGYILNEEDYHGIREKYHLIDKDGYRYYTRLDNLLISNRTPEKFSPLNPYALENLQNYLYLIGSKTRVISKTYINSHSKIKLACEICGKTYDVSPNHLISRNAIICPKCSLIKKGENRRIPLDVIKSEFTKSNLTPLFDTYNGYSEPLKCLDVRGNICYVTYATLYMWNKNGYSTYLPHHSRYESMVNEYLTSIHAVFLKEYTFPDCKDIKRLKFDFAIFKNLETKVPSLLIEVDGQQHFKPVRFKKMNENDVDSNFENIKRRDLIKDKYCLSKDIKLLRISYFDMENGKYKEKIKNEILQNITE